MLIFSVGVNFFIVLRANVNICPPRGFFESSRKGIGSMDSSMG